MGAKAIMVEILRQELRLRGVDWSSTECEKIVQRLVEQLRYLELSLAAGQFGGRPTSH
jgi:hypothetical protein